MPHQPVYLTEEGLAKLKAELEHLMNERRPAVAARIQAAKDLESTVNNAEYDDAKNEQAFVEGRILEIENILSSATVVHHEQHRIIEIGSTVKVKGKDGADDTYTIVGSSEADPLHGRISNESPVGRALLGKKVRDEVKVKTPAGEMKLKITKIS